ncbi:MAG: prepilin-type N-terminal cleavage/methylation domain-containing protein [Burkholderiales bacterium]|jgi:MSHA pilin protein MshC|nr:prepilin-type N-terminal cleavage/methylation domain-containing protein [Burkholderiales bacterium]
MPPTHALFFGLRPTRCSGGGQRGFTLVELILVLVILGVLSVYALPRMFDTKAVYARGFHDETLGHLRFAQKTAIAQRRTVCVTFTSTTVTLAIALDAATFNCTTPGTTLAGPKGTTGATVSLTAQRDAAFAAVPTNFNFDGLGQPITDTGAAVATQTFAVTDSGRTITVEAATGYIHENQ